MATLVIGGAGFIGTNLCLELLRKGQNVYAVDNLITGSAQNIQVLKSFKSFTFISYDICKPLSELDIDLNSVSTIYHLACPTGVPNLKRMAEEMLTTSMLGTKHALDLAKKNQAKIIITSSSEVYGDPKVFPQDESYFGNVDSVGIRSPYEEGKRFAESLAMAYFQTYNLDIKLVRLFNSYGPYMSFGDTRVIPKFLRQALSGEPITIYGNGLQTRTFCYIDDTLAGLLLVMEKGRPGLIYNLGSSDEIHVVDLAKAIVEMTKSKSKITYLEPLDYDHKRRLPGLHRIHALGWRQTTTLKTGLSKTLQWFGY